MTTDEGEIVLFSGELFNLQVTGGLIWYDIWVGIFIDPRKRRLFIAPFFCCVLLIEVAPWHG